MNGRQAGDPPSSRALITIASQEQPPRRIAGADAIGIAEQKAKDLHEQATPSATCRPHSGEDA
jgi:hypothetical protein